MLLPLLALTLSLQIADTREPVLEIRLRGNLVLADEVYLSVLKLPPGSGADEITAGIVEGQLREFLLRAGYELARVRAVVRDRGVDVEVHEGRLEKVVFRGTLTLKALQFKLGLYLPQEVFNRPALDRHLRQLAETIGIQGVRYELVPTQDVKHEGPQLENLGSFRGQAIVHAREPYELHFIFDERWDTGLGVDLRSSYYDGLEGGLNYQGKSLILDGDHWRVAASGGAGIRERVVGGRYYPSFSRTAAEGHWIAPDAFIRPRMELDAELVARQRRELSVENYDALTTDFTLRMELGLPFGEPASVLIGGGLRYIRQFGVEVPEGVPIPEGVGFLERFRPFLRLSAGSVFDIPQQRWDRRHFLEVDVRQFFAIRDPLFGEAHVQYQKVYEIGWHDLWIGGRGTWLWGEVPFHNEEVLAGRHLRSVFGDTYVHRVASGSFEFRFSVTRDIFKLSAFQDVAIFGELNRATGQETARVGNSFGAGFHALVEGMIQIDLYLAFGFTSAGRSDSGVAALLRKVF